VVAAAAANHHDHGVALLGVQSGVLDGGPGMLMAYELRTVRFAAARICSSVSRWARVAVALLVRWPVDAAAVEARTPRLVTSVMSGR